MSQSTPLSELSARVAAEATSSPSMGSVKVRPKGNLSLPARMVASLLKGVTWLSGTFDISQEVAVPADSMLVFPRDGATGVVISYPPLTHLTTLDGKTYTGYVRSDDGKTARLELDDGSLLSSQYATLIQDPFPTQTYLPVGDTQRIDLLLRYDDGLVCTVFSRVAEVKDNAYKIQQQLRLANHLPIDLNGLTDVVVSFQRGTERNEVMYKASAPALMAQSRSLETAAEATGAPVNLGPIAKLPKHSEVAWESFAPVDVTVNRMFQDIDLGSSRVTMTTEMTTAALLYPSKVYFQDTKTKTPQLSFQIDLQQPGSTFEVSMGPSSAVTVKESIVNRDDYVVTVASNVDYDVTVRLSGWQLNGRTDSFTVEARGTSVLKGKVPAR